MNCTKNYKGIKIDLKTPQVYLSVFLQALTRKSIDKIYGFTDNIIAVNMYFNNLETRKTAG
jgi:hypothetical protein